MPKNSAERHDGVAKARVCRESSSARFAPSDLPSFAELDKTIVNDPDRSFGSVRLRFGCPEDDHSAATGVNFAGSRFAAAKSWVQSGGFSSTGGGSCSGGTAAKRRMVMGLPVKSRSVVAAAATVLSLALLLPAQAQFWGDSRRPTR